MRNLKEYPITPTEKVDAIREAISLWELDLCGQDAPLPEEDVTLAALLQIEREMLAQLDPPEADAAWFAKARRRKPMT